MMHLPRLICRGFPASIEITRRNLPLAGKIARGQLTAEELIRLTRLRRKRVGIWWFLLSPDKGELLDAQTYADENAETVHRSLGRFWIEEVQAGEDDKASLELPLVLIAKRPRGWNPGDNPEEWGGLMGSSYIDTKRWKDVDVVEIEYLDGRKEHGSWSSVQTNLRVRL